MPSPPLEPLSREECDALLCSARFGRVIYTDRALPACTPVNYAVDGESVVFRTAPGSRLAKATDHQVVAFEVDDIDAATESGWTVIVTGNAVPITAESELVRSAQLGLTPWAAGEREHWVRLTPGIVTGRRLSASRVS
jgi:nitroimidazol reductase NimA-like FMN-containing flavoprotein (pyridoxamine 5'-phosphate oxidase superfamily)